MSFRKAQKARQKPHRERAQPADRASLGILEKKRDYKQRARNYQKKQQELKSLHKKALARNPDEFYFNMINKKLQDGVHWIDVERPEQTMSAAQKALLESQDLNYVNWKLQIEKQKVKKLSERIVPDDQETKKQHIIFVDRVSSDVKQNEQSAPELRVTDEQTRVRRVLKQRRKRAQELQAVSDKMSLQRIISFDKLNDRELVKKEDVASAAVYRWKPIRKK